MRQALRSLPPLVVEPVADEIFCVRRSASR
jgi:hypothetical protein